MNAAIRNVVVAASLVVVACGKRGDPKPPVPVIPKAASDLVVTQRGNKVILSWSYPSLTTAGKALGSIRRVDVFRYVEELPVAPGATPPADLDTTRPMAVALFSKLPVLPPLQFAKRKERLDSIEGASLPAATSGAKLTYEDAPAFRTKDGRPVRVNYAVVTEGLVGTSELSNVATIVPVEVSVPPTGLIVVAKPEGVELSWSAPDHSVAGEGKPLITGYNVYRNATGQEFDNEQPPINSTVVTGTKFIDYPEYGSYDYRVTAVAVAGPPRVESDASPLAGTVFKDLMPPPAPTNVTALVEPKQVRLVWDAASAPDLQGYLVYRWQDKVRLKLTPGPTTAPYFNDISVEAGVTYHYDVSSVDRNKNESIATSSQEILVPRTP